MVNYTPLEKYLSSCGKETVTLSFAEIEAILGEPLPSSALDHQAWWGNEGGNPHTRHVHAKAWYRAGYRVSADREARVAVFTRMRP